MSGSVRYSGCHWTPSTHRLPGTSIASTIANEFAEALDPLHRSSLLAVGFVLFALTLVVLALARLMLLQLKRRGGK